jgi:uncharacterized protein YukE
MANLIRPTIGQQAGGNPHFEIARDIGQQVESMILQAKHASESKVVAEIQKIKGKMDALKEKIQMVSERVNRLDPGSGSLMKADLLKSIAKLEEVWEGEVGTLKHELWQTIQAHNHNADLMKTHKDAIDHIQARTSECVAPPELEQIHGQLIQVDKIMQKEQAKQQQTDDFIRRLTIVQQQLSTFGAVGAGWAGPPGMPFPSMAGNMPGMQAMAGAGAPAVPAGTKASKKGAKAKAKAPAAVSNAQMAQGLRAEAAEFVPMSGGWE